MSRGNNGRNPHSQRSMARHDKERGGRRSEFNDRSGAGRDEAEIRINPVQVLKQLENRMPAYGAAEFRTIDKEVMVPTKNQRAIMREIEKKPVVMIEGTFGTGKTIWTCYMALRGLVDGKYNRIAINAPAVEAGEKLGFLPGDADEKMNPHVLQILEGFDDFIGKDLREQMQLAGLIETEPHGFLRGRTMKKTFFILDECQNASGPNLMTALSRLGKGSTFVFMGDNGQNDRTTEAQTAFVPFIKRYTQSKYGEFTGHVRMGPEDVRRHPFLSLIVQEGDFGPLEGFETHQGAAQQRKPGSGAPFPDLRPQP